MFFRTTEEVLDRDLTDKERSNLNRKRKPFHVFLSQYFLDYKNLSDGDKDDLLGQFQDNDFDDKSFSSTDTPFHATFGPGYIVKLASQAWKGLSDIVRSGCSNRTDFLNSRDIPGQFKCVPEEFGDSFEHHCLVSMSNEFTNVICRKMFYAIQNPPRRKIFSTYRKFVFESFQIQTQTYREMYISHLLLVSLFGSNYSKVLSTEKVYQSDKVTLFHFASKRRFKDLFTQNDLCAVERTVDKVTYGCAGKVQLKIQNYNCVGYIIDEDQHTITCLVENNKKIPINRPVFDDARKEYIFREHDFDIEIIAYHPIRFMIRSDGFVRFTINRLTTDRMTGNPIFQHCS